MDPKELDRKLDQMLEKLENLKKEGADKRDEIRNMAVKAMKEAEENGGLTKEMKEKADKIIAENGQLTLTLNKLTEMIEKLQGNQIDLEQKLAERQPTGNQRPRSWGETFVQSDAYKDRAESWKQAGGVQKFGNINVPVLNTITSGASSAGALIVPDYERDIVALPRRRLLVKQLLTQGRTSSNTIYYPRQDTRTIAASPTAEASAKPESALAWSQQTATVRTIAHYVIASQQALEDADQLQTMIDSELRYGLEYVEETQCMSGTGAGQELPGLVTNATAFSKAFSPVGQQRLDLIRLAMLQVTLSEYDADGAVLHPTDWAAIELTKDGQNQYVVGNPFNLLGPTLWGIPIVPTQSQTVDKFLVGAFKMAATYYTRSDANVMISDEDSTNFRNNLVTVRAEVRVAQAIKRALALVYGDFGYVG